MTIIDYMQTNRNFCKNKTTVVTLIDRRTDTVYRGVLCLNKLFHCILGINLHNKTDLLTLRSYAGQIDHDHKTRPTPPTSPKGTDLSHESSPGQEVEPGSGTRTWKQRLWQSWPITSADQKSPCFDEWEQRTCFLIIINVYDLWFIHFIQWLHILTLKPFL